jgi:glyoxylase I family protein
MPAGPTTPSRLHHNAYVTRDMAATRHFYEDLIGMPLIATWCEKSHLFGAERVYCHCFFGLEDGGALAFFQFASDDDQERFGPEMPQSPFHHIALRVEKHQQDTLLRRLEAAGYGEPDLQVHEHGYCRSLYVRDPNGLRVEFTVDHPEVDTINAEQRARARQELERWLAGDHAPNNTTYHRHVEL